MSITSCSSSLHRIYQTIQSKIQNARAMTLDNDVKWYCYIQLLWLVASSSVIFNALKGRGVNLLHLAIQV